MSTRKPGNKEGVVGSDRGVRKSMNEKRPERA